MISSSDNGFPEAPESPELEIHALASAYLDGQLSELQWEYLSQKPADHEFWKEWQDILRTEQAMIVGLEPTGNVVPLSPTVGVSPEGSAPKTSRWLPRAAIGMAAAVAIFVGLTWMMKPSRPGRGAGGQVAAADSAGQLKVFASSLVNCRWRTESERIYPGDNLIGRNISMESGVIKIHFLSGRMVVLSGDVEATFKDGEANSCLLDLRHGEIAVMGGDHDSADDHGFFIQTPMGLLEEVGTEFVVQVGDEVSVTVESGKVGVNGKENFTLEALQSALISHNGVTRVDRSFNQSEQRLFDLMPETFAGPANVVGYDQASMGNDIYSIIMPDTLLLVKERQNVLLENDIRYNIDTPGTYAFYREGEDFRPPGWKMPQAEKQGAGTRVDSYLVQFNPSVEQLEDIQVYGYVEFERPIQGILTGGYKLERWDQLVALPEVNYWPKDWPHAVLVRGLESTSLSGGVANVADVLTLSEDRKRLTIRLCASLRLDQIRVFLESASD